MDFTHDIDQKVAQMLASGTDPGPAVGAVTVEGAGAYRLHQNAVITAHPVAGVHEVHGPIMERYVTRMGGPAGRLGYPTSDVTAAAPGAFSRFEIPGSYLAWHPVYGVHVVQGPIGDHYALVLGGPAGPWGCPLSDEHPTGSAGRSCSFAAGRLDWTPAGGVTQVSWPGAVIPAGGDWPGTSMDDRMRYAMTQLVERYGFPANGAAGVVGNLWAESAIIPNRLQGSLPSTPMRAKDFAGVVRTFTAAEVMNRANPHGPAAPGVGLAQWTSAARRSGLFTHAYIGTTLRENVLFSMDAEIDYLVTELRHNYPKVRTVVTDPSTTVDAASDEVVYDFEVPGAILSGASKRPRTDPQVQAVFQARRPHSRHARASY